MQSATERKKIVISAINIFEGGPLSILLDLIQELSSKKYEQFELIFFIHKKSLINENCKFSNIRFIELPKSRSNYIFRLYYEYFYFFQFSKNKNIYFWLSLHDITPNVNAQKTVVYCHNATPFYKSKLSDLFLNPHLFISSLFYKYLYRINIHKNDFIIVQPYWIKLEFIKMFKIPQNKIIVASPIPSKKERTEVLTKINTLKTTFFYPCISRPFKNIEVIAEACKILIQKGIIDFQLILTIDGTENNYSKFIFDNYNVISQIKFLGKQTRKSVYEYYNITDILLFPSKLETWGLPITEFKHFDKPMLVSNLPYAKETVGNYEKVNFLDVDNPSIWASQMEKIILKQPYEFKGNKAIEIPSPKSENWSSFFDIMFKE